MIEKYDSAEVNTITTMSKVLAAFFALIITLFTLFVFWSMLAPEVLTFDLEKHKDKFGSLYERLNYEERENRLNPVLFVTQRVLFVIGAFYIRNEMF